MEGQKLSRSILEHHWTINNKMLFANVPFSKLFKCSLTPRVFGDECFYSSSLDVTHTLGQVGAKIFNSNPTPMGSLLSLPNKFSKSSNFMGTLFLGGYI